MTVLLYSEGLRDLGQASPDPLDPSGVTAGPLRHLIENVLGRPDGLYIKSKHLGKVHGRRDRVSDSTRGYAHKVSRAMRDAVRDGHDAIIVVIDRDGPAGKQRLDRLQQGRARGCADDRSVPCALGMAQEMVESWLLGDADAFARAFGDAAPRPPHDPEVATGARGSEQYAKRVLEDLLEGAGQARDWHGYSALARAIDTRVLEQNCQRSFAPFADDVRRHIGPIYGVPQER
jgi:hypothetical protein